ncbi:dephospho-CoA kinase [Polaribacter sp. ALD11]|uniref:dephospho-CoA kinase n=1 Tax=Polaribacter sp. ALD11 TaxID=2058137 RepID=UPI000C30ED0E|nr:dephospho-CoA kinase [Polaribacter sp. ALD11]AUC83975.1 dephospho-CoA kinase [Polaribacter sp. ALD11]
MVIGLTGGIGSGKTTVAKLFHNFNTVAVYIADVEAKKLMNSSDIIRKKLIEAFGEKTYQKHQLNRPFLASIVFNNKEKLHILNSIVHPEVKKHFQKFIENNTNKAYIVYESAILFESNSQHQFDFVISVFVDLEERIRRVLDRDNSTRQEVLSRINSQWKEDKKLLLSNYVINNYALQETESSVKKIHNILTKKAATFS